MAGRANLLPRRGKPAPFQAGKNGPVNLRHDSRRFDSCAGASRHDLARLGEMRLCPGDDWSTGPPQRRIGENRARLRLADARRAEIFARQIEPAEGRVLVEIAQNVGQLERAAKMMREAIGLPLPASRKRARKGGRPRSPRGRNKDRASRDRAPLYRPRHPSPCHRSRRKNPRAAGQRHGWPHRDLAAPVLAALRAYKARRYRAAIARALACGRDVAPLRPRCRRRRGRRNRFQTSPRGAGVAECASPH